MAEEAKIGTKTSITTSWLQRHSELYDSAIQAPFIIGLRNGTLDSGSYTRWLEQDYVFAKAFFRFIASTLAKAPDSTSDEELDVLLGGLHAVKEELAWFRSNASNWGLNLKATAVQEITRRYCKFLSDLSEPGVEYGKALASYWIMERVYNESFGTCLTSDAKTAPEYLEACKRWGSAEFKEFCKSLQSFADSALESSPSASIKDEAENLFLEVLKLEVGFWSMSSKDQD